MASISPFGTLRQVTASTDAGTMTGIELAEAELLLEQALAILDNTEPASAVNAHLAMAARIREFLQSVGR